MVFSQIRKTGQARMPVLMLCFLAAGCGLKLETGYEYRPLNSTTAERRAYYASPFSPEKSAADQEKKSGHAPAGGLH